jgi:hypothetical protein
LDVVTLSGFVIVFLAVFVIFFLLKSTAVITGNFLAECRTRAGFAFLADLAWLVCRCQLAPVAALSQLDVVVGTNDRVVVGDDVACSHL